MIQKQRAALECPRTVPGHTSPRAQMELFPLTIVGCNGNGTVALRIAKHADSFRRCALLQVGRLYWTLAANAVCQNLRRASLVPRTRLGERESPRRVKKKSCKETQQFSLQKTQTLPTAQEDDQHTLF